MPCFKIPQKKLFLIPSLILIFMVSNSPVFATVPVIDFASIQQEVQEITALSQQLSALKEQVGIAQNQLVSITGANGLGKWQNAESDLSAHQWSPSDWSSALDLGAGNNPERFNQLLSEYQAAHPSLTSKNIAAYPKGASQSLGAIFTEQINQNQASQSIATGAYSDVNTDFKTLHDLGLQIGDQAADPDLKHSVDLNSRVQLEIGNLAVQQLRMLVLLNQQLAQFQATSLEHTQEASAYLGQDIKSAS